MIRDGRPDPDALLREVEAQQGKRERGRLKVFLGASAGVGKTYAMLSEAREQKARGVEVVAGYIETHGRKETESLADGLERLPMREVEYRSIKLQEFDLDAALARKPQLILVDELAHTNAPESRHPKRWQDIDELLFAGVDVFTTVNVQHLESLNDVVTKVTGVTVRETVPDAFIDRADEIEVVDIPPDELRQRLRDGKVYVPDRIEHALEGFFSVGNLIALRELALRRAADRVDAQMQSFRALSGKGGSTARPRMIVCIAPNKLATRVVRSAGRIGAATHAEMIALWVESDRQARRSSEDHARAREALSLAEDLGMETVNLAGHDIVGEVVRYAQKRGASVIMVGKPIRPRWREVLFGSVVDELVRRSGDIDVHVITGQAEEGARPVRVEIPHGARPSTYLMTLGIVALATGVSELMRSRFDAPNIVMVYLLGVAVVASRFGPREAVLAAVASVLAFDFEFIPPLRSFAVSDTQYLVTFGVMLAVALIISSMTLQIRREARMSSERERRTAALYELSKELSRKRGKREIAEAAAKEIRAVFDGEAVVLLPIEGGILSVVVPSTSGFENDPKEHAAADWVCEHGEPAGRDTETLPSAAALYLPLVGENFTLGVVGFRPSKPASMGANQRLLLDTFVNGLALAMERANLAKESHEARIQVESEKIRSALFSSISHDLRTPLTSIAGAASSLHAGLGDPKELADTIYQESIRLNVQVQNLLDMTRLQGGDVELNLDWQSVEELIGSALRRAGEMLGNRPITVAVPPETPLLRVDAGLVERVFVNLFENVAAHTPPGSALDIRVDIPTSSVRIAVADHGPGLPKGAETRVFDRFFGRSAKDSSGFGLGLSIARAVMKLHNGRIWAKNRDDEQGATFYVEFPKPTELPPVPSG